MSARQDRGPNLAASLAAGLLLLTTSSGCASSGNESDGPTRATDSSASSSDSPGSASEGAAGTMPVGDTVEPGQALVVSVSNVDEQTSPLASALVDNRAVDTFLDGTDARLAAEVRTAMKDVQVPAGSTLFGSVVAVGCEVPASVSWESTFDGVRASAQLLKSSVQCLVPVTSVALFLVEDTV